MTEKEIKKLGKAETVALLTSHSDLRVMQPYIALHSKTKDAVIDTINKGFENI